MNSWRALLEGPAEGAHIAQVYQDDDFLIDMLSHFVRSGLARGEGVVLFVTPRHWEACVRRLGAQGAAPLQPPSVGDGGYRHHRLDGDRLTARP